MGIVVVAFLAASGCGRRRRDDDVDLQPDQLGREVGQPVEPTLRESILDDDVLALDPPELTQPFPERLAGTAVTGGRAGREEADPIDLPRRLRLGGERRGEEAEGASDEGSPVHYWITSSARASTAGGIVRPSALAVLRLITNSNFVGCSTGRSAGFAPLGSCRRRWQRGGQSASSRPIGHEATSLGKFLDCRRSPAAVLAAASSAIRAGARVRASEHVTARRPPALDRGERPAKSSAARTSTSWSSTPSARAATSRFLNWPTCAGCGRVPEHGDASDSGHRFLEQLQPLAVKLGADDRQPRDVAARAARGWRRARSHGVAASGHHDRDRRGRLLGRRTRGRAGGDDDVHLEADELRRQLGKPFEPPRAWRTSMTMFCPSI